MSEITPPSESDADYAALTALIADDVLQDLEAHPTEFNIFEPILGRWEIRHSDWLAFLLDPQQSHDLGDAFLRAVLQHISAASSPSVATRVASYATGKIDHVSVHRERHHIDILVLLRTGEKELAVIIENKIGADEGLDQLERYRQIVQERYHSDVVGIYLTPDGRLPRGGSGYYAPVDYKAICNILKEVVRRRDSLPNDDVSIAINHYVRMVRRSIVSESDIVELCRRIYQEHHSALDLIYKHRPDKQVVRNYLDRLIEEFEQELYELDSRSDWIALGVRRWESIDWLKAGDARLLFFVLDYKSFDVRLSLQVGPGGPADTYQRIDAMVSSNKPPFHEKKSTLNQNYQMIYTKQLLRPEDGGQDIASTLDSQWRRFISKDFQRILMVVM